MYETKWYDTNCPRPALEKQLAGFVRSGQNVVIHGERRMGKTSLINAVVRGMRGWRMVYVDLLHVQTVGDVCRRIVSAVRYLHCAPFIGNIFNEMNLPLGVFGA